MPDTKRRGARPRDFKLETLPNAGVQWRNVNFFSGAPALIDALDRLQIEALGLPFEPLIDHLRIMRSSSSWNLP